MTIEHVAFVVGDPEAAVAWYCEHLGLREVRRGGGGDIFVSDETGQVILQFEDARLVDSERDCAAYAGKDARILHMAFCTENVAELREKLLAVGATEEGGVIVTEDGDEMTLLRDPWGLPFQLVRRKVPMR